MTRRAIILVGLTLASCQARPPAAKTAPAPAVARAVMPTPSSSPQPAATPPEPTPSGRVQLHPPAEYVLEDAGVEPREAFRFGAHEERVLVEYSIHVDGSRPSGKDAVPIDVRSLPDDEAGPDTSYLWWQLAQVNGVPVEFPLDQQGISSFFDARGRELSSAEPLAFAEDIHEDVLRQLR